MSLKTCLHCGMPFTPCATVPSQTYCSAEACQRARRCRWQANKRLTDPDYHDNQARAQKAWQERHPKYWAEYRNTHCHAVVSNRTAQQGRDARCRQKEIVFPGPIFPFINLSSGRYRLARISWYGIAKMDVLSVVTTSRYERY